jgi:hypothetical protein
MSGKNERTPKNFYQRFLKKMQRRKSRFTTNLCRYIQTN